jgi:hypothetical protein
MNDIETIDIIDDTPDRSTGDRMKLKDMVSLPKKN